MGQVKGYKQSPEHIARRMASRRAKNRPWVPKWARRKISASMKALWKDKIYRARMTKPLSAAQKRRWREYHKIHPIAPSLTRDARLQKSYGITEGDYDRMHRKQKGLCALCSKRKKLQVDHDHETGKVRGLLCWPCNSMLGLYEKNRGRYDHYLGR